MNAATKNEIIRRFYSGQSMRGIARELHVSRKTVRRVIDAHEHNRKDGADTSDLPSPRQRRGSQVDAYEGTIRELLARYPDITATRVLEELRSAGYTGGYTILRERVNELLREQFGGLGDIAVTFLEGLLRTQRHGWHQAQTILALRGSWHRDDLLAAMQRAVTFGAYSRDAIERILASKAKPKSPLDQLAEDSRRHLDESLSQHSVPVRPMSAYQQLLFEESDGDGETQSNEEEPDEEEGNEEEGSNKEETDGDSLDESRLGESDGESDGGKEDDAAHDEPTERSGPQPT